MAQRLFNELQAELHLLKAEGGKKCPKLRDAAERVDRYDLVLFFLLVSLLFVSALISMCVEIAPPDIRLVCWNQTFEGHCR